MSMRSKLLKKVLSETKNKQNFVDKIARKLCNNKTTVNHNFVTVFPQDILKQDTLKRNRNFTHLKKIAVVILKLNNVILP